MSSLRAIWLRLLRVRASRRGGPRPRALHGLPEQRRQRHDGLGPPVGELGRRYAGGCGDGAAIGRQDAPAKGSTHLSGDWHMPRERRFSASGSPPSRASGRAMEVQARHPFAGLPPGSSTACCAPRPPSHLAPSRSPLLATHLLFPPHTRGWTFQAIIDHPHDSVSPAHAGMDPVERSDTGTRARFPRTRGDGPVGTLLPGRTAMFPPHTRGWTASGDRTVRRRSVSPAHAGMDLGHGQPMPPPTSFPRTRGDGPAPRSECSTGTSFPPHTRGWTVDHIDGDPRNRVSPAHAGMDPGRPSGVRVEPCFPRTRGDGPVVSIPSTVSSTFPPHTRGWTVDR